MAEDTPVLTEDEAIELFAFLMTSARSQIDDPCQYASLRLLTAAEDLRDRIVDKVGPEALALFERTRTTTTFAQTNTNDLDAYTSALDELCTDTARFLVERLGVSPDG